MAEASVFMGALDEPRDVSHRSGRAVVVLYAAKLGLQGCERIGSDLMQRRRHKEHPL